MAAVGMIFLGGFIGSVIGYAIRKIDDWSSLWKILGAIVATSITGSILEFIDFLGGETLGNARFFYPVGLILGFACLFAGDALKNIQSSHKNARILGWLHILGLGILFFFIILILFSPPVRQLLPK